MSPNIYSCLVKLSHERHHFERAVFTFNPHDFESLSVQLFFNDARVSVSFVYCPIVLNKTFGKMTLGDNLIYGNLHVYMFFSNVDSEGIRIVLGVQFEDNLACLSVSEVCEF